MSFASVWGFALVGIEAVPVRVEVHARSGLPGVSIVGLPGAAVKEARERIRSGAASGGFPLPTQRITINLSPGDVPKDGPGFDLPMALATIAACGYVDPAKVQRIGAVGEVALDGMVRSTRGMLSIAEQASELALDLLIIPAGGLPEADAVSSIPVAAVRSLFEAVAVLRDPAVARRLVDRGSRWLRLCRGSAPTDLSTASNSDMHDVKGHAHAKRALEVVAAGGHHLLMVGSPGTGKTMLARRLPGILPPLARREALEVTKVWGAAGIQQGHGGLLRERPFRAPHHTASRAAIVGGGLTLRPGEVSLAHRGVLFLDELPEFSRDTLEALRQPLEEGRISISRRNGTLLLPADCSLVGAMNPCPCGFFGHPTRECRCTASQVDRYRNRISGPLLDRMDVLIEVPAVGIGDMEGASSGESSEAIRSRVVAARSFRESRVAAERITQGMEAVTIAGQLTHQARALLRQASAREPMSGRGYTRILKVARTIADLDNVVEVGIEHVAEALSLRLDCDRLGSNS